jgi:hypothetical protein
LGGAAQFEEERARGVPRFESGKAIRNAAEDDSQLVIEIMRGCSGDGAGAIVFEQAFHIPR